MYKTSFCGLEVSVKGVYSAYNLTEDELKSLKERFGQNINGSNGNYTVYAHHDRRVNLILFVHGLWQPLSFNIRKDLLKLYGSDRIYKKDVEELSKKLKERRICLHVEYDYSSNRWDIVDYDSFLDLLKELIASQ